MQCDIRCHRFFIYYAVVMSVHFLASRVIDQTHPQVLTIFLYKKKK
jgi:hypothetical protein